jgi:hypothetical protein
MAMVEVMYIAESYLAPADYTVAAYRRTLRHVLNISVAAEARVDGQSVSDEYRLTEGSVLEFVVARGEKGMAWCTVTELAKAHKLSPKRARKALEQQAELVPACCLPTLPQHPNQPHKLYDENKVRDALLAARKGNRYRPPPCPICHNQMSAVNSRREVRYLKCQVCGFHDSEPRMS